MSALSRSVAILPYPPQRGRKRIIVDGEPWGAIHPEFHGCNGVSYWFQQWNQPGAITDQNDKNRAVTVRAGGRHRRSINPADAGELLLAKAIELVERRLLKHPSTVKLEQKAAHKRLQELLAAEAREQHERNIAVARALVKEHLPESQDNCGISTLRHARLVEAIAAALQKARDVI
jgi:hypothetical protein